MTRVVHCKKEPYDVLIDRNTKYGNPYVVGIHGSREECIEKFRKKAYANPEFLALVRKELKNKTLACWCKPKACHGDIYVEICDTNKEK
ncbi:MAG TPA: DUF4326 domain-containing protein [bacterium]|nr:DUF4326 domain-containing protein [bacterium]